MRPRPRPLPVVRPRRLLWGVELVELPVVLPGLLLLLLEAEPRALLRVRRLRLVGLLPLLRPG